MAPGITLNQKQQAELKEAFIIYDSDQDGKVSTDQATQIIRSIGISPTMDEISDMLGTRQGDKLFTLEDLKRIIQTKAPPVESRESLLDAFRIFDKVSNSLQKFTFNTILRHLQDGNGFIDAKELRHVLVHLGEKLKDDEVDELLREVDINGDNQISYEDMVRTIECLN
ncbi:calmodulin-A-like isoform X1 [Dreissena polymorpha]|uniref:calmodulin-A-like isoform X1 n=1 Tax=Dreissena polymorpha TaxID=45954 RepID=UPI0022655839|nr:calmodulin-A-like isoform X1 [Dreissena polymorpha]